MSSSRSKTNTQEVFIFSSGFRDNPNVTHSISIGYSENNFVYFLPYFQKVISDAAKVSDTKHLDTYRHTYTPTQPHIYIYIYILRWFSYV